MARKMPARRKVVRATKSAAPKGKAAKARPGKSIKPKPGKIARTAHPTRPAEKPVARSAAQKTPAVAMAKAATPVRVQAIARPQAAAQGGQSAELRAALAAAQARSAARRMMPVDDDEETGGHNLLLGPRNVRPYLERKGEQYMGKEQLEHFRTILNTWKRDLMEEVDRTMTHMKDEAANPPDPNDRATLESEFALELRTRDRERKLIRKIDEALSRIDDGSYGYCVETGEPIGVKRLEARPVATLCIEAQERRERREKQYGDRDDWYR